MLEFREQLKSVNLDLVATDVLVSAHIFEQTERLKRYRNRNWRVTLSKWPVGAFTSIDAGFGVHLPVVKELGIPTIQVHAPHKETRTRELADSFKQKLVEMELELTAVFGGFDGESYESISIVKETVGLVPPSTRAARLAEMKEISDFARWLECDVIALHIGFIPHDTTDPNYNAIVDATADLCGYAKSNGQNLHLETGQETAEGLLQFVADTGADNLFVNFDPANMILYGTGEPIAALKQLGHLVRSVHCKDATWSDKPGETWGKEVPLGDGEVGIESYLQTLEEIGYEGPLTIEREIPQEPDRQKQEIGHAANLLESLKGQFV